MLQGISIHELEMLLQREYPHWADSAYPLYANQIKQTMDERLESALSAYAADGTEVDYTHDEFSVLAIRRLRRCSYLEALRLMDTYLKDPRKGRIHIMRR